MVTDLAAAVRAAAHVVDVPGTPRSLRLDDVVVDGDAVTMAWSVADPSYADRGDRWHGTTTVTAPLAGEPGEVCWAAAQLAAAHRWKQELDGDEMPGVPWTPRVYTVDDAWQALLRYLATHGEVRKTGPGEITVDDEAGTVVRLDPVAWAAYLSDDDAQPASPDTVPTGGREVDGLPLWAADELDEEIGSAGPVIGLVRGRLGTLPDD